MPNLDRINDELRRALAGDDALQRCFESLSVCIKDLELGSSIRDVVEGTESTRNLMRAVLGSTEDIRLSNVLDTLPTVDLEVQKILSFASELEGQFRLPQLLEIPNLLQTLEMDGTATALTSYRDRATELSRVVEGMTTPWLNMRDQTRSLTGLLGLHEIGHVLNTTPIFNIELDERLRSYLGDWRSPIDWPSEIFNDPVIRSDFYIDRGLDPTLTEFPGAAFDEAITIAGIKRPLPSRIDAYDYEHKHESDGETGFKRNNAAHDRLQRFESHIRSFIDQQMTAAVGDNWIKHRVSGEIRQLWKEKQEAASENGEPKRPLIAYADFTDYEAIIVRNDNWKDVFAPIFRRKRSVQESFQRLYPIRVCTMHARIITQDDKLYLVAETQRLLKAMGIVA